MPKPGSQSRLLAITEELICARTWASILRPHPSFSPALYWFTKTCSSWEAANPKPFRLLPATFVLMMRNGKLRWSFHTIPHPGEFGYDTWPKDAWKTSGAANNWAGMALDSKTGILYVPTGSAAFDFYGGDRIGDDLFANCL